MRVLLLSTYELGRQPFGLASPAAWLREAGAAVACADLSRTPLPEQAVRDADLVAFFLPMHTATRLALPVIDRVRALNPRVHLCAYGLYAPLNEGLLLERGVDTVLGPEFEQDLVELAESLTTGDTEITGTCTTEDTEITGNHEIDPRGPRVPRGEIPRGPRGKGLLRLAFRVPDRSGLPPLDRYAQLQFADGSRRVVGYTEGSRGCKHRCRHCPIVPVYEGRFRIVPVDVVVADIRAQVAAGARHITFGDPDFFNSVKHALAIVQGLAREHAGVSYDVTIKVEHLVRHAEALPALAETGCAFVTSAVESVDDRVLERLAKGHTRADVERAVALCRAAGIPIAPTFVAFTPWTTREGYVELLDTIERLDLVEHVSPIQLAIRLLVPHGSLLLELPDMRSVVGSFNPATLTYSWRHPDPEVDRLQRQIEALVGRRINAPRREVFEQVRSIAGATARDARPSRATIPYLTEPWYC